MIQKEKIKFISFSVALYSDLILGALSGEHIITAMTKKYDGSKENYAFQ